MSEVEERLSAALAAKADTVHRSDLRPAVLSGTGGTVRGGISGRLVHHRLRAAALVTLAAVVIGAVLLLPGALAHRTDQEPANPPPRPTAPPSTGPSTGPSPLPVAPSRHLEPGPGRDEGNG